MVDRSGRRAWIGLLLLLLVAPLTDRWAVAQEDAPAARRSADEAKPRAKSRGRLPMYYSKVVTDEQREQIYELQAKFDKQVEELLAEMRAIEMQRDEEIEAVLTPDQRAQVAQMVEDAQKRRQAKRNALKEIEDTDEEEATEEADES